MKRVLACLLLLAATTGAAADFYVAPTGNDAHPGTAGQPLATLRGARDAIRKLKAAGPLVGPVTVHVAEGTYTFVEPLVLEPEDSGTAQAPITYQAAPGAHPVFSGGRRLSGWQPDAEGRWKIQLPEVAAGRWYFEQLFVNGRRAVRARTPNKQYFFFEDVREAPRGAAAKMKTPKDPRGEAVQTVRLRAADAQQSLARIRPEEVADVNLVVYHNWDNTRRRPEAIDAARGTIVTSGERMKPWNPWKRNSHFVLENFFAALDAPGEWFLARNGTLYYIPLPGEDMAHAEVVAPVADKFLILAGEAAEGKLIEHVAFRGLSFQHNQWLTPRQGCEPMQAAAMVEAAVMVDGARNVTFEDCEIAHMGGYGLWFRKGCRDCTLARSYVHDFGAGAVRIGEIRIATNLGERTGHITVDNNILRQGGAIFPCAVGLLVAQSGDNQVTHNEIADLFYTGISAGWTWGYNENLAKNNTFAFNHVHHLGHWLLSDMGGIYTLGPSEGTVVRNNVFHDIFAYSYGGWGMYTDEGSTGILFENNLVYATKTGSFHQHYGKENVLRNNILAESLTQQIQATRVEDHLSFTLEKNLVYWTTGKLLAGPWDKLRFASHDNLFWQSAGQPVDFLGRDLAAWQAQGHEQGSRIADPKFADPAHADFRLPADSPALAIGFRPFDPAQAGVYGAAEWVAQARSATYPAMEEPPAPPPLEIHEDFEDQPAGSPPSGCVSHVEHKGDAIVVTDETAAGGKHALKIVDAPGLRNAYDPHLTYENLNHATGKLKNAFDMRIARSSRVHFEWRDYDSGAYATGLDLSIRNAQLLFGKGQKLALPVDQWFHVEITAELGPRAARQWTLRVTLPDGPPREFAHLPLASPQFQKLTWIGIMSDATEKTTFYLDNIELTAAKQP